MNGLISLCMIVKNEAHVLKRCLESAKPLVDEIIVMDTGSTDETVSIAKQYTEKVYHFQWIDDFSAAKNAALEKATGTWILVLDADEYLQPNDHEAFRRHLQSLDSGSPIGIILPILNFTGNQERDKANVVESSAARVFPNAPDIRFTRPIHEQLTSVERTLTFVTYPFTIFHTGYTAEIRSKQDKVQRNLRIFNKYQQQTKFTPYDDFTFGNEYYVAGDYKKAVQYLQRAYQKVRPNDSWYALCCDKYIHALLAVEHFREALDLIDQGLQRWPGFSDYYCIKGYYYDHFGFYELAKQTLEAGVAVADEAEKNHKSYWLSSPNYGRSFAYTKLAEIYEREWNLPKAVHYLSKTLQQDPKNWQALYKLASILSAHESAEAVQAYFDKVYPADQPFAMPLLLHVFSTIGNAELSDRYDRRCREAGISVQPGDRLRLALLGKDRELFEKELESLPDAAVERELRVPVLAAAYVWRQPQYLSRFQIAAEDSDHDLYVYVADILNGKQAAAKSAVVFDLLHALYTMGFYEEYDAAVRAADDPALIGLLGDYLYSQKQIEWAMDYYDAVMKQESMAGSNFANLGMYCLLHGMPEEGVYYLRQAASKAPQTLALYGFVLSYCEDASVKREFKDQFAEAFPHYRSLPFINQA